MTALSLTTIQNFNKPSTLKYGTAEKRLVDIYVECTSAATANTLNLATYLPGLAGILGVQEYLDGAKNGGTANTWSTTTITFAGHAGSGVWKLFVTGHY
jgi:hypothetical protein